MHLLSYGDARCTRSKRSIFAEAKTSNWCHTIEIMNRKSLDKEFVQKYFEILREPRGGGYWIWKFNIIMNKLKTIRDGTYLVYLDAGCTITSRGGKKLKDTYRQWIRAVSV